VDGARLADAGADGLVSDGRSLSSDASGLRDALETGGAALPAYTDAEAARLGSMIASPVAIDREQQFATTMGAVLAPYFMAIALWVGALATYLVLPASPGRRGRRTASRAALAGLGAGVAVGGIQALLMVAGLRLGLGLEVSQLPALVAMAILASLAAAAVTQALVAWGAMRGWLVALFFVILQLAAAGGAIPIETAPAFLRAVHPLLPMTYAVEAFRTLIEGGGASVAPAVVVQLGWACGAFALTVLAVRRRERHPRSRPAVAAT
jgi:putative membrane protein